MIDNGITVSFTLVRFPNPLASRPPSVPIGFVPQKLNITAKLDWLPQTRAVYL